MFTNELSMREMEHSGWKVLKDLKQTSLFCLKFWQKRVFFGLKLQHMAQSPSILIEFEKLWRSASQHVWLQPQSHFHQGPVRLHKVAARHVWHLQIPLSPSSHNRQSSENISPEDLSRVCSKPSASRITKQTSTRDLAEEVLTARLGPVRRRSEHFKCLWAGGQNRYPERAFLENCAFLHGSDVVKNISFPRAPGMRACVFIFGPRGRKIEI